MDSALLQRFVQEALDADLSQKPAIKNLRDKVTQFKLKPIFGEMVDAIEFSVALYSYLEDRTLGDGILSFSPSQLQSALVRVWNEQFPSLSRYDANLNNDESKNDNLIMRVAMLKTREIKPKFVNKLLECQPRMYSLGMKLALDGGLSTNGGEYSNELVVAAGQIYQTYAYLRFVKGNVLPFLMPYESSLGNTNEYKELTSFQKNIDLSGSNEEITATTVSYLCYGSTDVENNARLDKETKVAAASRALEQLKNEAALSKARNEQRRYESLEKSPSTYEGALARTEERKKAAEQALKSAAAASTYEAALARTEERKKAEAKAKADEALKKAKTAVANPTAENKAAAQESIAVAKEAVVESESAKAAREAFEREKPRVATPILTSKEYAERRAATSKSLAPKPSSSGASCDERLKNELKKCSERVQSLRTQLASKSSSGSSTSTMPYVAVRSPSPRSRLSSLSSLVARREQLDKEFNSRRS